MYISNKSIRPKFEVSFKNAENLSEKTDSSETDIKANNATTWIFTNFFLSFSLTHFHNHKFSQNCEDREGGMKNKLFEVAVTKKMPWPLTAVVTISILFLYFYIL